jgi:large conductance mechanosensitive channel
MLTEFRQFLFRGNIVDLAVAVVIGTAFVAVVNAFVADIITPIIAAIFGKPDFQDIGFDIGDARISVGLVINAIVSFIVVAALLFVILKAYNRMRATRTGDEADTELSVLREIRDSMRAGGRGSL